MRLAARLQAIADLVEKGTLLADIGTDHAYLPIYLVQNKIVSQAIAGEVSKGPYKAAQQTIKNANLQEQINLRFGNGLQIVRPGEINTSVIAGMGGTTITKILDESPEVVKLLKKLLIQPMIGASAVRRWIAVNGWCISDEILVLDDGRLYEIIAAEPGKEPIYEEILYEIGPLLWKQRSTLLEMHINQLIQQVMRVLSEMTAGNNYSAKYYAYEEKLRQLEAKKACL